MTFHCKVDVPTTQILVGAKGSSRRSDIMTLATESVSQDLLGIMVWYASVENGFQYKHSDQWDATTKPDSISGYRAAMQMFRQGGRAVPRIYY